MAGYRSDITRTVVVGEPSVELRRVHEVVRTAQQAGVDAVRPGVPCEEVDAAARTVIEEAGTASASSIGPATVSGWTCTSRRTS